MKSVISYSLHLFNAHKTDLFLIHIFELNMINSIHLSFLIFLIKTVSSFSVPEDEFNVYGHVPGLEQSQFYRLRLRKHGSEDWHEPFTFVTECTAEKFCNTTGVYNHLRDWSNSYINFEMLDGVNIEIEISKLWGDDPIEKAVVLLFTQRQL